MLVEIPATFETVEKQRLVQAESFRMEYTPPVFSMVPQAAPPVEYRWQRFKDCEVPADAIPYNEPPTGTID